MPAPTTVLCKTTLPPAQKVNGPAARTTTAWPVSPIAKVPKVVTPLAVVEVPVGLVVVQGANQLVPL